MSGYQFSKFAKLFVSQGGCFLYSSLTNSFAKIEETLYEALSRGDFSDLSEEDIQTLSKMKVIGVDDETERDKIKFKLLSSRFNPTHLTLTLNPTLACNFACRYCFEGQLPNQYMTDETEDAIVEFVKKHSMAKVIHVTWFGGEPLLAFNRIISLTEKLKSLGKGYEAGMISNGYLLTQDKIRKFRELGINRVQITIDGAEYTHDKRRPLRSGAPTFDTIVNNIRRAQDIDDKLLIIVRVNLDETNQNDYDSVIDLFPSKDFPSVIVYPAFVSTNNESRAGCIFDDDEIARFFIKQYYDYGRYTSHFYPTFNKGACAARNPNSFIIGPSGELYKCWNDVGIESNAFGNVLGEITNEKVLYQYLMKADAIFDKECDECTFMPVCSGGCPYVRIQNELNGKKASVCSLFKKYYKEFLSVQYNYRIKK